MQLSCLFSRKALFSSLTRYILLKRNVKGRQGRRRFLAAENMPNLLEIPLKLMVSSATSSQNPSPRFFIQIKLLSAKQNKKYQPCVVVSDPGTAHPCWLLHGERPDCYFNIITKLIELTLGKQNNSGKLHTRESPFQLLGTSV